MVVLVEAVGVGCEVDADTLIDPKEMRRGEGTRGWVRERRVSFGVVDGGGHDRD